MNRPPIVPKPAAPVLVAPPRRSKAPWVIVLGVLLLAALGGGYYYKQKKTDKGFAVTIEKAVIKTITQMVNATGKIQPEVEVKIAP